MSVIEDTVEQRVRTILAESHIWDNHGCLPIEDTDRWLPQLIRYRDAGVSAATINIGDSDVPLEVLVRTAARIRYFVKQNPQDYLLGGATADIGEAKRSGRLAIFLDVEGLFALADQLSLVELLYDIGVRWMLMVYNHRNLAGSGCHDLIDDGLSDLGRRMVAEMDRVGMIKCCSHTGYRTARDVMEMSPKPVIFSHSNARRLRDHPRNIPDDLIRACAETGGVVGVNGVGIFLGDNDISVAAMVRHIDHIAQLVGAAHVGLGLDHVFNPPDNGALLAGKQHLWPPEWGYGPGVLFAAPEIIPQIAESLVRLGYPDDAVRGVLGENLIRVADAVWT